MITSDKVNYICLKETIKTLNGLIETNRDTRQRYLLFKRNLIIKYEELLNQKTDKTDYGKLSN